jgi:hypothetical protein
MKNGRLIKSRHLTKPPADTWSKRKLMIFGHHLTI